MRRALSQALFVAMVAACGTARVIQRTPGGGAAGGTIELEGDRNKAMEQANEEMAAHCGPNNFTIVQDGEEEVDAAGSTDPVAQDVTNSPRDGRRSTAGTMTAPPQSTRTRTVWRVHYQCGTGSAPDAGPPSPEDPSSPAGAPAPPASR